MSKARGFTLVEILIAVIIVGILATIAIPSYRQYVLRSNRVAAQTSMLEVLQKQQQYFIDTRQYADTLAKLKFTTPPEVSQYYTLTLTLNAGPPASVTVTATPKTGTTQSADPTLVADSKGAKAPAAVW